MSRKILLGRDPGCEIAIADDSVSAIHAELSVLADGKLLLTDCKSTNGARLLLPAGRERAIRQELVSPTDRILPSVRRMGALSPHFMRRITYVCGDCGPQSPRD